MAVLKTRLQTINGLKAQQRKEFRALDKKYANLKTKYNSAQQIYDFVKSKFPNLKDTPVSEFEAGGTEISVGNINNIFSSAVNQSLGSKALAARMNLDDRTFLKGKNPKDYYGIPITNIPLPDNSGVVSVYRRSGGGVYAIADRINTIKSVFVSKQQLKNWWLKNGNKTKL